MGTPAGHRRQGGGRRGLRGTLPPGPAAALVLAVLILAAGPSAIAAETTFMDARIEPLSGSYLVKQDANVRAEPKTESERLGRLKRNEEVEVVGKAAGAWLAVRKDGADLGFVYAPILMPLIDGRLDRAIIGKTAARKGTDCTFTARFTGKNPVAGEAFETSDYDVGFTCKNGRQTVAFSAFMFITEAPYQLSDDPDYQISIDVPQVGTGDDLLSTVFLYRKARDRVVFDSVGLDDIQKKPAAVDRPAKTVAEALTGALEMVPMTWNDIAWARLSGKGT